MRTSEGLIEMPVGERIKELIEEKKRTDKKFSYRYVAKEAGYKNHRYLQRIIEGDILPKKADLAAIAGSLDVTVERMLRLDVRDGMQELRNLLQSGEHLERAEQIAEAHLGLALGVSERCDALCDLGMVRFWQRRFEEARALFAEACPLAEDDDPDRFFRSFYKWMHALVEMRRCQEAQELFQEKKGRLLPWLDNRSRGHLYHLSGRAWMGVRNYAAARSDLENAEVFYALSGDHAHAGMVLRDRATVEFLDRSYERAKAYLEKALDTQQGREHREQRLLTMKNLAQAYMSLGSKKRALEIVNEAMVMAFDLKRYAVLARLLLLKAYIEGTPAIALDVLNMAEQEERLQYAALQLLTELYLEQDNLQAALKYYKICKEHRPDQAGRFWEEDWF